MWIYLKNNKQFVLETVNYTILTQFVPKNIIERNLDVLQDFFIYDSEIECQKMLW